VAYVFCRDVQAVPRVDVTAATVDMARLPYESGTAFEVALAP
jgi:hypothetical protein